MPKEVLLKTVKEQGFPLSAYPKDGRDAVIKPGFYFNKAHSVIEHWSFPAKWNAVMADHSSNDPGLICDGFQSVLAFDDVDALIASLKVWADSIKAQEENS